MRHNVRALIIKDKKLLLVTGHNAGYYWTPGGGIEKGETPLQALDRELQEELGSKIIRSKWFMTFEYRSQLVTVFFVEIDVKFKINNEISEFTWYKQGDDVLVSGRLRDKLLPELTRRGMI